MLKIFLFKQRSTIEKIQEQMGMPGIFSKATVTHYTTCIMSVQNTRRHERYCETSS